MATVVLAWLLAAGALVLLLRSLLGRRAQRTGQADAFVRRFETTLAMLNPDIEVLAPVADGFGAAVRVAGQEWVVPLGELYLQERAYPGSFENACRRLVSRLEEAAVRVEDHPFDEAASLLLPQVRTRDWVRSAAPAFGLGALVCEDLCDGLVVCFVLDDEDGMVFVTQAHLEQWGVGVEAVRHLAETNLRRLAGDRTPVPRATERITVVDTDDGYANSRLLLALGSGAGAEDFAFAVPDRDTLLLASPDAIPDLVRAARERYARALRPISPAVFRPGRSGRR